MNRFQATFDRCHEQNRTALMPYITAGDPDLQWTEKLIDELVRNGADMIELGMPYSDPLADGPTVQAAGQRALSAGTTIDGIFQLVARVRSRYPDLPIALLIYYNCIFRRGEQAFVEEAAKAGLDGLIVPDLPPEESTNLRQACSRAGLRMAYLAAPTSTPERLRLIATLSDAFIYCVSLTGVTGARQQLHDELGLFIQRVRDGMRDAGVSRPLAVGFGISTTEHVRQVGQMAEGVIVGSALIDRLQHTEGPARGIAACGEFLASLKEVAVNHRAPEPLSGDGETTV